MLNEANLSQNLSNKSNIEENLRSQTQQTTRKTLAMENTRSNRTSDAKTLDFASRPRTTKSQPHLKRNRKKSNEKIEMKIENDVKSLHQLEQFLGQKEKIRKMQIEVSPEVAAIVVEKYLIPMFESDNRVVSSQKRSELFGKPPSVPNSQRNIMSLYSPKESQKMSPIEGTVYAELKLSERLNQELKQTKSSLEETTQKLKDTIQAMTNIQTELDFYRGQALTAQTNLQIIKQQFDETIKQQNIKTAQFSNVQHRLDNLNRLYEEENKKHDSIIEELRQEKALSDQLRNKNNELDHGNAMLRMENEIISERIRALYVSTRHMNDEKVEQKYINRELKNLIDCCTKTAMFHENCLKLVEKAKSEQDYYEDKTFQFSKQIQEIIENRDQVLRVLGQKMTHLQKKGTEFEEQSTKLYEENKELKEKNNKLTNDLDKFRLKVKTLKSRFRRFGDQELKTCKNCARDYSETENYNWACRTHSSEYSGQIWWCCGKEEKNAPGCKFSKHETKEDEEDELDAKEREEADKLQLSNIQCSSCKEIGHKSTNCERDPNYRTSEGISKEIVRIEQNALKRTKAKTIFTQEIRKKMIIHLSEKLMNSAFGQPIHMDFEGWKEFSSLIEENIWEDSAEEEEDCFDAGIHFFNQYKKNPGFSDLIFEKQQLEDQNIKFEDIFKPQLPLLKESQETVKKIKEPQHTKTNSQFVTEVQSPLYSSKTEKVNHGYSKLENQGSIIKREGELPKIKPEKMQMKQQLDYLKIHDEQLTTLRSEENLPSSSNTLHTEMEENQQSVAIINSMLSSKHPQPEDSGSYNQNFLI